MTTRWSRPWVVVGLLGALAILGPWLTPYDPTAIPIDLLAQSRLPSFAHWLGTDPLGRDIASRLLAGSRYTLGVAGGAITLALVLGVFVGALSAVAGGWVDRLCMRVVDLSLSVPRLVLLLSIIGIWGRPSVPLLVVVLGASGWVGLARVVRQAMRREMAEEHVLAARALGVPRGRLFRQYLLPPVAALVMVWATTAFGQLILLEAGLSFLGLGIPAPAPSWGTVLQDVGDVFGNVRWLVLGPGLLIALIVMLVQHAGEAIEPQQAISDL